MIGDRAGLRRLDAEGMDFLRFRLRENRGIVGIDELQNVVEYARFLFSKRGALIEQLEALHAAGKLDLGELVELYRVAEWTEADGRYLADWQAHDPRPPTYWRAP
jgi:hypothetical protein